MANNCGQCCVHGAVYYLIFSSFVGGILYATLGARKLTKEDIQIGTVSIIVGLGAIITGSLLLTAVIKRRAKFVVAYLSITAPGLVVLTISLIYFAVKHYGTQEYEKWKIILGTVTLCVALPMQFCVYLFYKELAQAKRSGHAAI